MSEREKQFLMSLANLVEQYDATFSYTTADDGTHITVDGRVVFADFLGFGGAGEGERAAKVLRQACGEVANG